jgi:hypothetical protein
LCKEFYMLFCKILLLVFNNKPVDVFFWCPFKIIKIDESKQAQSVYIKNYSGIYTTLNLFKYTSICLIDFLKYISKNLDRKNKTSSQNIFLLLNLIHIDTKNNGGDNGIENQNNKTNLH